MKSVWDHCINPKGWIHLWNGNDIDRGPLDQCRGPSGTSLWWPWLASDLAVRRYNYLLSTLGTNPSTNPRSLLQSLWPRWHWQSCGLVTIPQGWQRFTTEPRFLWPGWYAMDSSPAQWTHQLPHGPCKTSAILGTIWSMLCNYSQSLQREERRKIGRLLRFAGLVPQGSEGWPRTCF